MKKNPLEWTVFGVSLALLVALVGYLGWLATHLRGEEATEFRVRLGPSEPIEGGFRTRVNVENLSDSTTRMVKVEVEGVEIDMDYVPRRSEREGYVVTEKPPKKGRVVAWQKP